MKHVSPFIIISTKYPEGELFQKWSSSHKFFNYIIFVFLPVGSFGITEYILSKIFPRYRP